MQGAATFERDGDPSLNAYILLRCILTGGNLSRFSRIATVEDAEFYSPICGDLTYDKYKGLLTETTIRSVVSTITPTRGDSTDPNTPAETSMATGRERTGRCCVVEGVA